MKPSTLLLLLLALGGCTRWEVVPTPAPRAEGPRTVGRARVTPMESGIVILRDVQVTADSVIGWRNMPSGRHQRVALHREQVRIFEHRGLNPVPNALVVLVAAYAVVVWYYANNPDL